MIIRSIFTSVLAFLSPSDVPTDPLAGLIEQPIDIELRGAPIADVFMLVQDVAQVDIDLDPCVGGTVDLVYLGGVAFSRERTEISQNFPTILGLIAPLPPPSAFRSTTISYGTRPLAGVEARIRFTSHVRLIPGVRLQGITEGWLLRPYVGLGWFF